MDSNEQLAGRDLEGKGRAVARWVAASRHFFLQKSSKLTLVGEVGEEPRVPQVISFILICLVLFF